MTSSANGETVGDNAEAQRLAEDAARTHNWKRWGPYLSERQWGTVREDYSANGDCWEYLPHDHARSRAYRWGEDGLLGLCDREGRLCLAPTLWNGRDPILKERLFGLSGPEGNHGEDVKECYYFLDATPTSSYLKALYKYPLDSFPYERLLEENRRRGRNEPEFELSDTGIFDDNRYVDLTVEYAKCSPNDLLICFTLTNRSADPATLHLLPTVWLANTWAWGRAGEGYWPKGQIALAHEHDAALLVEHPGLGAFRLIAAPGPDGGMPTFLFTDNETNQERLFGVPNADPYVKDAFHAYLIEGRQEAVNPHLVGTKAAVHYTLALLAGETAVVRLRFFSDSEVPLNPLGPEFDSLMDLRRAEADRFYSASLPTTLNDDARHVARQAYAGLLWSKQFYHYGVRDWLEGDPALPPPPPERQSGRNVGWQQLYARDVITMPDTWEYPWFAAWDLAFHTVAFSAIDPAFAKEQLILFMREWYQHPNGQIPAYEFSFGDVNPPVQAWAAWHVYKATAMSGAPRDRQFLARIFHKHLLTFTWWVNRKDVVGNNIFSGGFLGLDNIGVFDRSRPLPTGGTLEQADGTAWMAFYCVVMLSMALELAREDPSYEDIASKFFEHFVAISDAMNTLGGSGLWDETDGFYYDQLALDGASQPLRVRSVVGLIPLIAATTLEDELVASLPGFAARMRWFLLNRSDLAQQISYMEVNESGFHGHRLLALPSRARLERLLRYLLDEEEFFSPYGVRSLSRVHRDHPYQIAIGGQSYSVDYEPGESTTGLFGGNSNWRGPIWFPINYLLLEALERYGHFYGDTLQVACPTGSGHLMTLDAVAQELRRRLVGLFLADENGTRPWQGGEQRYATDPHWRDLLLFHEYFHGESGRGCGASHQTGWTALVARCLDAPAWDNIDPI